MKIPKVAETIRTREERRDLILLRKGTRLAQPQSAESTHGGRLLDKLCHSDESRAMQNFVMPKRRELCKIFLSFRRVAKRRRRNLLSRPAPRFRIPEKTRALDDASADDRRPTTNDQRRGYALAASCPPSGKKYCVPLIGSLTFRRSSCRSSLRSTKSISEVFTISRSDDV